jgi:hypothetical protein
VRERERREGEREKREEGEGRERREEKREERRDGKGREE